MTALLGAVGTSQVNRPRRWLTALGVLIAWAGWRATADRQVVNAGGWPSFARFWRAIVQPDLDPEFVRLTVEAAATTAAYAVLGTLLSVGVGLVGGFVLADRPWESARG